MALGAVILVNSRPFESTLLIPPVGIVVGLWFLRQRQCQFHEKLNKFGLPFMVTLIVGAGATAAYHHAVTGGWMSLPHTVHYNQYFHQGPFVLSGPREPALKAGSRLETFLRAERTWITSPSDWLTGTITRSVQSLAMTVALPFGVSSYTNRGLESYKGLLTWLVLLIPLTVTGRSRSAAAVILGLVLIGEALLREYAPLYPTSLMPLLVGASLLGFIATESGGMWSRLIWMTVVLVIVGQTQVRWWWPHYAAPVIPLILAGVARAASRLFARRQINVATVFPLLAVATVIQFATLAVTESFGRPSGTLDDPLMRTLAASSKERASLVRRLTTDGRRHLVFVCYDADFPGEFEWVFNGADLVQAPIVFAHDLGSEKNEELRGLLPEREAWLLRVGRAGVAVERYSANQEGQLNSEPARTTGTAPLRAASASPREPR